MSQLGIVSEQPPGAYTSYELPVHRLVGSDNFLYNQLTDRTFGTVPCNFIIRPEKDKDWKPENICLDPHRFDTLLPAAQQLMCCPFRSWWHWVTFPGLTEEQLCMIANVMITQYTSNIAVQPLPNT